MLFADVVYAVEGVSLKIFARWIIARWFFVLTVGLACGACTQLSDVQSAAGQVDEPSATEALLARDGDSVVALGRLVPQGQVIQLSVPNAEDSRVNRILVEEGDFVEANQVIAILQGFERRQRDLKEAQKTVELHQAKLNQLLAGAGNSSELAAQRAAIAELEARQRNQVLEYQAAIASAQAELEQARSTYERNQTLASEGALAAAQLDQSAESVATAEALLVQRQAQLSTFQQTLAEQIEQERNLLTNLSEVRPTDEAVSQAELERAQIAVEQRQADLEETQVRVPVSGQILRINTRVGERVNTEEGIIELGNTEQMMAIAEVYETDVVQIAIGQKATLSSEYGGFVGELRATVEHIGLQIGARRLSDGSSDPTTDENQRVVEVRLKIHPEDSPKVASLTNMQVRVEIETGDRG
ncbi:MAG: HlyD family efflux transporter periplasmic adaptor subunit [Cyanobacteria bacterium J06623_4]